MKKIIYLVSFNIEYMDDWECAFVTKDKAKEYLLNVVKNDFATCNFRASGDVHTEWCNTYFFDCYFDGEGMLEVEATIRQVEFREE